MNDSISRQAAIDTLNDGAELLNRVLDDTDVVGAERAKYEWGLGLIESYIADMKELPSAEPEQKTGKWVNDGKGFYKCTLCGEAWSHWWAVMVPPERMYKELRFCPNCGVKMEKGENE